MDATTNEKFLLHLLHSKIDYYYKSLPEAREKVAEQMKCLLYDMEGIGIEEAQERLRPLALAMDLLKAIETPQDY